MDTQYERPYPHHVVAPGEEHEGEGGHVVDHHLPEVLEESSLNTDKYKPFASEFELNINIL